MSNLFGPPPPPQPEIYEPGTQRPRVEPHWVDPDPHPGRRRGALLLAFLAVCALVLANLAFWLDSTALKPGQARTVADATYPQAVDGLKQAAEVGAVPAVRAAVTLGTVAPGAAVINPDDAAIAREIDATVASIAQEPALKQAWQAAVADALAQERERLRTSDRQEPPVLVRIDGPPLAAALTTALNQKGYRLAPTAIVVDPYVVSVNSPPKGSGAISGFGSSWALLALLAVALGAASIATATRRLRMAAVLSFDAAAMLLVGLLIVPLGSGIADQQATDPAQSAIIQTAYGAVTRSLVVQTGVLIAVFVVAGIALAVTSLVLGRREADREPAYS